MHMILQPRQVKVTAIRKERIFITYTNRCRWNLASWSMKCLHHPWPDRPSDPRSTADASIKGKITVGFRFQQLRHRGYLQIRRAALIHVRSLLFAVAQSERELFVGRSEFRSCQMGWQVTSKAWRCAHASWQFLLFFARRCHVCTSWFVQGPCFWNSRNISYLAKRKTKQNKKQKTKTHTHTHTPTHTHPPPHTQKHWTVQWFIQQIKRPDPCFCL